METIRELNERIIAITLKLNEEHPELSEFLNEMPVTLPNEENPEITLKVLNEYYDSLGNLLTKTANEKADFISGAMKTTKEKLKHSTHMDTSLLTRRIQANGINMSYDQAGEGIITLIFIHGFPFDKSLWQAQLTHFESNYRVIAYDIRGFGKTTDNATEPSIQLFADDLIAFMDALRIEKAVICGLSMGGFIALNAISRFPERVEALVLCDTLCHADTIADREKRYKTIQTIENEGLGPYADLFIKAVFHPDSITGKEQVVADVREIILSNEKRIVISGLMVLAKRKETCYYLEKIQVPVLILCGKEDEVTPPEQSEFMHKAIAGSVLHLIEQAGHLSNIEQVTVFNAHLNEFLIKLPHSSYQGDSN